MIQVVPARGARAALALAAVLAMCGCKTPLSSGLSERDANEEVALLLRSGIPAAHDLDPKDQTLVVTVEQSRFADAVDVLHSHGLPHQHYDSIVDVFKGGGLVSSPISSTCSIARCRSKAWSPWWGCRSTRCS